MNSESVAIRPGSLVFLTQAYERYVLERNPNLVVGLVNRLAKLEEIIDWESDKGKKIKAARLQSGKWGGLPLEDNRYVFSVYYHDLIGRNGKPGVIETTSLFSKDPKTGEPFFVLVPDWISKELLAKNKQFSVESVTKDPDTKGR